MKYNGDDNKSGFWEQEKSRLEDKLVNKIFKCLIRFLIEVIVMTVLIVGINIFTNGMYLWGLPRINDIQSVNITYPSVTDDVKEISSSEDIELALKLTGFLKYDLFGEVNSEEEPAITITYFLKDGTSKTISANNTTVWWNNKIHVIKDKEMFVNLTEGIFFLEDFSRLPSMPGSSRRRTSAAPHTRKRMPRMIWSISRAPFCVTR